MLCWKATTLRFLFLFALYMGVLENHWPGSGALASPFDPAIMKSVVAVLPKWPQDQRAGTGIRDAPEGTAVAILPGGYLVTNSHVLGRARKVDIRFPDGRLMGVSIVGRDPRTDLALLRASMDFPVPPIAKTAKLGAKVCAVGNQFGLGLSVTCGVVSAVRRTNAGFNLIEDFVQTDASVNPGGSGGALVDGQGHLIGIVSAIFTKTSDSNIGVNFAVNIGMVLRVVEDLKNYGRVKIGVSGFTTVSLSQKEKRRWSGARVSQVTKSSAAELAGLRVDDLVTHIGLRPVFFPSDLRSAIFLRRPGDIVSIRYVRRGVKAKTKLTLKPGR